MPLHEPVDPLDRSVERLEMPVDGSVVGVAKAVATAAGAAFLAEEGFFRRQL